jgi:hypothetical protein
LKPIRKDTKIKSDLRKNKIFLSVILPIVIIKICPKYINLGFNLPTKY